MKRFLVCTISLLIAFGCSSKPSEVKVDPSPYDYSKPKEYAASWNSPDGESGLSVVFMSDREVQWVVRSGDDVEDYISGWTEEGDVVEISIGAFDSGKEATFRREEDGLRLLDKKGIELIGAPDPLVLRFQ